VQDIDIDYRQITVRSGKDRKDLVIMLPASLIDSLHTQLYRARQIHNLDLDEGYEETSLPFALARKYPNAGRE